MEPETLNTIISCGTTLATMIASGTVTAISAKVQSIKGEKDADKIRNTYDEILSQVLQERSDAIRIAQTYKSEYEKIAISDDDIEHLHNTIDRILGIIFAYKSDTIDEATKKNLETIKGLINKDTLKTLQLLGFNFKTAIGEPLTEICANAINSWGNNKTRQNNSKNNGGRR